MGWAIVPGMPLGEMLILLECYISHKSLSSRTKHRTQRKNDFLRLSYSEVYTQNCNS